MLKIHIGDFKRALALLLIVVCAGCGKPVVGVYQIKWQGNQGENTKTFDFRSDGTCVYTPNTRSEGQGFIAVDTQAQHGTWMVEDGNVVSILDGNSRLLFKQEGNDLIAASGGARFIRIR
jgi:cephalosporin-C deacetylase-like acetyl esterase